eukprot:g33646.t1
MRRPSDLERWHQQLAAAKPTAPAPRPQRPRAATAAVATVAAELMSVIGSLRSEPDGPKLFRLNDTANELIGAAFLSFSEAEGVACD